MDLAKAGLRKSRHAVSSAGPVRYLGTREGFSAFTCRVNVDRAMPPDLDCHVLASGQSELV